MKNAFPLSLPVFRQKKSARQNGAGLDQPLTVIPGNAILSVATLQRRASGIRFGGLFLLRFRTFLTYAPSSGTLDK
ncbi:hypothetical protein, partial [Mesorhizobium sp. M7A.F.Ca.MR.176.00.0.0]|uniref:hypothetical protein n=1 Tax=Mesorhizobium sp. M7A.F.Ca.MR.176.00.0.0 TaxID=2496776 RepID=UPI0019D4775B